MSRRKKSSPKDPPQRPSESPVRPALRLGVLAGVAILIVAAVVVYLPSLNGGFILDDNLLLTNNPLIKASNGLYRFWCTFEPQDYWPVTNTTLWIEWRLWGMHPTGYHVTNLLLHIIASLLIWLLLRKLSIPGAFLAAMIFAVHPVNVESVAWIAQRKNTLAMVFFLLSILWYLKAETRDEGRKERGEGRAKREEGKKDSHDSHSASIPHPSSLIPHPYWYGLSLLAFVLGMLSKGSIAVLPVLLLGIVWWRRKVTWWDLVRIAPFFVVAGVLGAVNIYFQTRGGEIVIRTTSFLERLLEAGAVVWFYLSKALLPIHLVFIYPMWEIETGNLWWWLPLASAVIVTAVLWWYRQGWSRPFLFAWGFFCVALVPVMGFTDVGFMKYSLVADHYQHIAILGVIVLTAAGWSVWRQRAPRERRWTAVALAALVAGVLALLTWEQNKLYCNAITLYQATLKKNPKCWLLHNNLGNALLDTKRLPEAIEHYRQALRLKPNYAEAHNNLGKALTQKGLSREAIEHYRQAIKFNPYFAKAYSNLGVELASKGRLPEAIKNHQQALSLNPNYAGAHNNLGNVLIRTGRFPEAITHYRQALQLEPNYADAYYNLGNALHKAGRLKEAIEQYEQALRLEPHQADAHNNLGFTLAKMDRLTEAIEHHLQTLRLEPNHPNAHYNLGNALYKTGRLPEAIEQYKQAIRLEPHHLKAYKNLMLTYEKAGRASDALATAQKTLDIARSTGQTKFAKRIGKWMTSYRASLSNPPSAPPAGESVTPPP